MKSLFCLLITLWGSLALIASAQAQSLNIPAFARPQISAPQINLPASRPRITTPTLTTPNLTPRTTITAPTVNTSVTVPSFPNVNTVGARLIQSSQTVNFPNQTLPTQFLPASITPPNTLNSTLPLELIAPKFPNTTTTVNQLQLVPTLITFPKQTPQISIPVLSTLTATPLPTVTTDLNPEVNSTFGIQLDLKIPSSTTTKTNFDALNLTEQGVVTNGGLFNRTLD
jgi:hypothetical protein